MNQVPSKVYLLKIDTPDRRLYKIGVTTTSISQRIKSLQTGCPYEISLVDYYESSNGHLVEKTLHRQFSHAKTFGEWFALDITEEGRFRTMCSNVEDAQDSLEKIRSTQYANNSNTNRYN